MAVLIISETFNWDEISHAHIRAELDAYYACLHKLTRNKLRYILDLNEIYGASLLVETFCVLKEKEIKQFGVYGIDAF